MNEIQGAATPPRKGRGCLFYGCLTLVVTVVLVIAATYFTARYVASRINGLVDQYSETTPMVLPEAEVSAGDYAQLEKRLAAFQQALQEGRPGEVLKLTSDDLNALIARNSQLAGLRDRVRVRMEGDQLKGQVSLPLGELARLPFLSRLAGRYVNGAAAFRVALDQGRLSVHLVSLEVKGQPLPEEVMAQLRQENWAQGLTNDPRLSGTLSKLDSLVVKDGVATLTAGPTR